MVVKVNCYQQKYQHNDSNEVDGGLEENNYTEDLNGDT